MIWCFIIILILINGHCHHHHNHHHHHHHKQSNPHQHHHQDHRNHYRCHQHPRFQRGGHTRKSEPGAEPSQLQMMFGVSRDSDPETSTIAALKLILPQLPDTYISWVNIRFYRYTGWTTKPGDSRWQLQYLRGKVFKISFTCLLTCPGDLSDDAGSDLAFMDGEQLEDDEELRLHIHGCNSFFTKWAPQYDTICGLHVSWHA